jgi:hypothetical protein
MDLVPMSGCEQKMDLGRAGTINAIAGVSRETLRFASSRKSDELSALKLIKELLA